MKLLALKICDYCRLRIDPALPPKESSRFREFLLGLIARSQTPPRTLRRYDWEEIAFQCDIDKEVLRNMKAAIEPALDAITRNTKTFPKRLSGSPGPTEGQFPHSHLAQRTLEESAPNLVGAPVQLELLPGFQRRKSGKKPRAIKEFPTPLFEEWIDPPTFREALELHLRRHGDSYWHLHRCVVQNDENFDRSTILQWLRGSRTPRGVASMQILDRIEKRYGLAAGYFKAKLPHQTRSVSGHSIEDIGPSERRRLAWHLPDDFNVRTPEQQGEILEWVRRVIIRGSTDYRRFQAAAMKQRYAIRFPADSQSEVPRDDDVRYVEYEDDVSSDLMTGVVEAPSALAMEMADLIRFKTATLTALGLKRNGVWGQETASQKVEHFGLMFGALAADPSGPVRGYGVPSRHLTFGLLIFPSVWDWYVQWRERRRGFYTAWEVDMLRISLALTRKETGWLRQCPNLGSRLRPIEGLVSQSDIDQACASWDGACDNYFKHASSRVKEIHRVAKVHRDPFEPIMPVLEAESPVGEYRKITEEILRLMPDERLYRRPAAEAVWSEPRGSSSDEESPGDI